MPWQMGGEVYTKQKSAERKGCALHWVPLKNKRQFLRIVSGNRRKESTGILGKNRAVVGKSGEEKRSAVSERDTDGTQEGGNCLEKLDWRRTGGP